MSWSALRLSLTVTGRMHVKSDELSESRTTAHPSLPVLLRRSLFPSTSRVLKCVFFLQLKPSRHTFYFEFHRGKTDGREETLCVCLYICANEILQSAGLKCPGSHFHTACTRHVWACTQAFTCMSMTNHLHTHLYTQSYIQKTHARLTSLTVCYHRFNSCSWLETPQFSLLYISVMLNTLFSL